MRLCCLQDVCFGRSPGIAPGPEIRHLCSHEQPLKLSQISVLLPEPTVLRLLRVLSLLAVLPRRHPVERPQYCIRTSRSLQPRCSMGGGSRVRKRPRQGGLMLRR